MMKSKMEVLKFLFILENLLNIHRNYFRSSRRKRFIIVICIFLDIICSIAFYVLTCKQFLRFLAFEPSLVYTTLIFLIALMIYGFAVILFFAPMYGREFRRVLVYFRRVYAHAQFYSNLNKSLRNLKRTCYKTMFLFVAVRIFLVVVPAILHIIFSHLTTWIHDLLMYVVFSILRIWVESRFVFITLMFCSLLSILSYMLRNLLILIKNCKYQDQSAESLKKYIEIYHDLLKSSKLLMVCFGLQVRK